MRVAKDMPELDTQWHVLLHIKHEPEAKLRAFSPIIIIDVPYLQTFLHTRVTPLI